MYLLDANIVSDLIRNPVGAAARRMAEIDNIPVATSIIVAAELRFGVERKPSRRLAEAVAATLKQLSVLSLGDDADIHYGRLRADLQRKGCVIGANDMLIAAHALSLGATLVTDNVREFARVEGLTIENWLRD